MFIEVIAQNLVDAKIAESAGANRIELVAHMSEDGLTPSESLVATICKETKIALRVMVRFHNQGFIYTQDECEKMCQWIIANNHLPIEGYVLGGLTETGMIDTQFLDAIAPIIGEKKVTFHRAFDRLTWGQQEQAVLVLKKYPFVDTILTSGGIQQPLAKNLEHLKKLAVLAAPITLLVGGGVNEQVFPLLQAVPELQAIHIGSAVREHGDFHNPISARAIQNFKQ